MSGEEKKQPTKKPRVVQSTIIDHSYEDFANTPLIYGALIDGTRTSNFPAKLHEIMSNSEYEHIIGWMPHGRSWMVKNKELLESVVLKEHFSHSNFESFNRQVNLWGFKRLHRAGPDYKTYYHQAFLRGRPDITALIERLKNPGKRLPNVDTEPNFYAMPFLPASLKPQRAPATTTLFPSPTLFNAPTMANVGNANNALANLFQNYQNANAVAQATTAAPAYHQFQVPPSIYNYNPALTGISLTDVINQQALQAALQNAGYQMPGAVAFPNTLTYPANMGTPSNVGQTQQQVPSFAQFIGGNYPSFSGQNPAAAPSSSTAGSNVQGPNQGNLAGPFSSLAATPASLVGQNNSGLSSIDFANLLQASTVARADLPSNVSQPSPANAPPNNPLSRESAFLLSNPHNHPIQQDFTAPYQTYLGNSNSNSNEMGEGGNRGGGSSDSSA